ncbi:MAG TPA: hypothetical protein VFA60_15220 [Terriglobales bacterium]|nr:hypothetical protein [Terriglobales bacterium]
MVCNEYRGLMFERLSGELSAEQERAAAQHEQSCAVCRAELAQFKSLSARLRAGWPAEDAPPLGVVVPQHAARNWLDVAGLWFSRASAAVVMAALVALVLVRPAISRDSAGVHIAFGGARPAPVAQNAANAPAITPEQLQAMVDAAVAQRMAQAQPAVAPAPKPAASPDSVQVAYTVRQLQQSQAVLAQEVQSQHLVLESLWRDNVRPASLSR